MIYAIAQADPYDPDVADLIALHLVEMRACSPACSVHAMPAARLAAEDVTFWAARDGAALAAVGALKAIGDGAGEIKSMRAAPAYRGRGAGRAMLDHIVAAARQRGWVALYLETGRAPAFAAATALYRANDFVECGAFADYPADDPFSLFMMRTL